MGDGLTVIDQFIHQKSFMAIQPSGSASCFWLDLQWKLRAESRGRLESWVVWAKGVEVCLLAKVASFKRNLGGGGWEVAQRLRELAILAGS